MTIAIIILVSLPGLKIIADAIKKETAYQLMVDGKTWCTVSQKEALEKLLNSIKTLSRKIDKKCKVKEIYFHKKIEIIEVKVKPETIETLEVAKERIDAVEDKAVEVEIKKGDNFWNLSKAYDITVNELEILNPDLDPDKIFPGDKVVVKASDPVLDVLINLENTVLESIPFNIEYKKDNNLYKNQKKIIKEGIEGQKEVIYNINCLMGTKTRCGEE